MAIIRRNIFPSDRKCKGDGKKSVPIEDAPAGKEKDETDYDIRAHLRELGLPWSD